MAREYQKEDYTAEKTSLHWNTIQKAIAFLIFIEAITFVLAALMHMGVQVLVGFVEPVIIPAAIVEWLIGLFFAVSAYAIFTQQYWAWLATIWAHGFSIAGILLGMVSLALGLGPSTEANELYHRVMLAVAVVGVVLLLTPAGKAALGRNQRD